MRPSKQGVLIWRICVVFVCLVSIAETSATVAAGYTDQRTNKRYTLTKPSTRRDNVFQRSDAKWDLKYARKNILTDHIIRRVKPRMKSSRGDGFILVDQSAVGGFLNRHRPSSRSNSIRPRHLHRYPFPSVNYNPRTTRLVKRKFRFKNNSKLGFNRPTEHTRIGSYASVRRNGHAAPVSPPRRATNDKPLASSTDVMPSARTAILSKLKSQGGLDEIRTSDLVSEEPLVAGPTDQDRETEVLEELLDVTPDLDQHPAPIPSQHSTTPFSRQYKPTQPSTTSVLRIRTTSMTKAQQLIRNLGNGFKISFAPTTPRELALLRDNFDIQRNSAAYNSNLIVKKSVSGRRKEAHKGNSTIGQGVQWWLG